MVFEILIEACASFRRRIVLDSRFRGNDVMPALRLRSGQAPAGIQGVGCAPRAVDQGQKTARKRTLLGIKRCPSPVCSRSAPAAACLLLLSESRCPDVAFPS